MEDLITWMCINYKCLTFCSNFFQYGHYYYSHCRDTMVLPVTSSLKDMHSKIISAIPEGTEKIFIHKSCNIPRDLVSSKFKKVLDPSKADVCVMPHYDKALFPDKDYALLQSVDNVWNFVTMSVANFRKEIQVGDEWTANFYGEDTLCKVVYIGELVSIPSNYIFYFDYLLKMIPNDKPLIDENVIIAACNTESNKVTLDALLSIRDMLNSDNVENIKVALDTLSALDYANYECTVKFLLNYDTSYSWTRRLTKMSSRSKFMFKVLGSQRLHGPKLRYCSYPDVIRQQDYDLLCQYIKTTRSPECDILTILRNFSFVLYNPVTGAYKPNIVES